MDLMGPGSGIIYPAWLEVDPESVTVVASALDVLLDLGVVQIRTAIVAFVTD
jgi:hypothetical protein